MPRIVPIPREHPTLKTPILASANNCQGPIRGNRKRLKRSSLGEQLLRRARTVAAYPPDSEFAVACGHIRGVNNMLSIRSPHGAPIQRGIERQPGCYAALEVV